MLLLDFISLNSCPIVVMPGVFMLLAGVALVDTELGHLNRVEVVIGS